MNTVKHTPGPWKYCLDEDECSYVVHMPENGIGVRYIATGICQGEDEGEADAKLIAAAPELLSEVIRLKKRIQFLEQYTEGKVDKTDFTSTDSAIKKATE